MHSWKLFIFSFFIISGALAQEQLTVRINESGILKILGMGLKYNTGKTNSKTLIVPSDIYKLTIKKEQLLSNPIIPVINEITNLDLSQDLDFFLRTTDIWTNGRVDFKSLKVKIINSRKDGFDIKINLELPVVLAAVNKLEVCEDRISKTKYCGEGLKASFNKLRVETKKNPVKLGLILRVSTKGFKAKIKVISVESNLEADDAPELDIALESVDVPKMTIVINDQEAELDTSSIRNEILARKDFLGKKLLKFVADFIANDVAEMMNKYLMNKSIKTSWEIFKKDHSLSFDEFEENDYKNLAVYSRPAIAKSQDTMDVMMSQIADVITNAQMNLSVSGTKTHLEKDLELTGIMDFMLNNHFLEVKNKLGNTDRQLPPLFLASERNNDINLVVSEPLINGVLDLVNSTGLFKELLKKFSDEAAFTINSVKLHFTSDDTFTVVLNSQIDLKSTKVESMSDSLRQSIATRAERNNNNAVIFFPLEFEIYSKLTKLSNGQLGLYLKIMSPFDSWGLKNTFDYPSNVDAMTEMVREGMLKKLQKALGPITFQSYNLDLTKYFNQSGVSFTPKKIALKRNAYLLINLDIDQIDFDQLKKGGQ
ncbi:MAG: hypothetical protein AB7I27_16505 [Bacteriovoracaceae bacterium]